MTDIKSVQKKDLIVTRVFDAPVKRVWKAWTEPERMMRWWGAERLHVACLQDRPPGWRRVSQCHAIARGPRILEQRCLP